MVNTKFYTLADEALAAECARIEAFTAELDKNPTEKKAQIAEYKCAKYRYATISAVHASMHNINPLPRSPRSERVPLPAHALRHAFQAA